MRKSRGIRPARNAAEEDEKMMDGYMDNIIAVKVEADTVKPFEYTIVTEARPWFLPPATLVKSENESELLYSCEGLVSVIRWMEGPGSISLAGLFGVLTGYIRCLIAARDMLLDTRLLSSDPGLGVLVQSEIRGEKDSFDGVKSVWGADDLASGGEKICRIASALAGCERVMGARASMERMIEFIRSENPSLLNCLKTAEILCREWKGIVSSQ